MLIRFFVLAALALSLSACASTPQRYAFWRNDNATAQKPNLGDVPAPPNTEAAKADMETMKTRLQKDRDNAYLAAQGFVPVDDSASANATTASDVTAPARAPAVIDKEDLAPPPVTDTQNYLNQAPPNMPMSVGNVQYNYAPEQYNYVYGNSPVQINMQGGFQEKASDLMASNPNVSIDYSVLGGADGGMGSDNGATLSPAGLNGQPLVYFNHGSSRLDSLDKKRIRDFARQMKGRSVSLVLIGHSSSRTGLNNALASEDVNLRMSARRATVVMQELARLGVPADRIKITASGDAAAAPPSTRANEAADRRVDILFDR